jgi:hypothetical protein
MDIDLLDCKKSWYMKNIDKMRTSVACNICGGKFTYYNKSHHIKSKKHINATKYKNDNIKKILHNIKAN